MTLVSEDNMRFKVHRLVFASASEYFTQVFIKAEGYINPTIKLEGTTEEDLQLLLDYIYHGEIRSKQKLVKRFLDVGSRFKIEGIQESLHVDTFNKSNHFLSTNESSNEIFNESTNFEFSTVTKEPQNQTKRKRKPRKSIFPELLKRDVTFIRSDDIPSYEVFEEKVDEMFEEGENGKFTCKVC